jgi:hypothetical protein
MNGLFWDLLRKYKRRGLVIDSNILLLYFVGECDPRLISTFKRTKEFTAEDFVLLQRLFNWFNKVVTTPNILTEVSSLANQLSTDDARRWRTSFQSRVSTLAERYLRSNKITASSQFVSCGLADASLVEVSRGRLLPLTDDLRLYVALQSEGIDAINFNHIREFNWSL